MFPDTQSPAVSSRTVKQPGCLLRSLLSPSLRNQPKVALPGKLRPEGEAHSGGQASGEEELTNVPSRASTTFDSSVLKGKRTDRRGDLRRWHYAPVSDRLPRWPEPSRGLPPTGSPSRLCVSVLSVGQSGKRMARWRTERLWVCLPHFQQHRLPYGAFQSEGNLRTQNFIHKILREKVSLCAVLG